MPVCASVPFLLPARPDPRGNSAQGPRETRWELWRLVARPQRLGVGVGVGERRKHLEVQGELDQGQPRKSGVQDCPSLI